MVYQQGSHTGYQQYQTATAGTQHDGKQTHRGQHPGKANTLVVNRGQYQRAIDKRANLILEVGHGQALSHGNIFGLYIHLAQSEEVIGTEEENIGYQGTQQEYRQVALVPEEQAQQEQKLDIAYHRDADALGGISQRVAYQYLADYLHHH